MRGGLVKLSQRFLAVVTRAARDVDIDQLRSDVAAFSARRPELTRRQQAERLVRRTARRAAALGAAASLPPGWAAFAALGPELSTLIWLQSRMILGLHVLYGKEPDPEERGVEVLAGLASGAGMRFGRALGARAAEDIAERLVARTIGKGGSRFVPVVGIAAGTLLNYVAVIGVGRAVIAHLERQVAPEPPPLIVEAHGTVT